MKQPVIVVIDPSCADTTGHHLTSLLDLLSAIAPAQPEVLVHKALPSVAFPDGVAIRRVFDTTVYDQPGLGPRPNDRLHRRLWKLRRSARNMASHLDRARAWAAAAIEPERRSQAEDWAWSQWRRKWPSLPAVLAPVGRTPVDHIVAPSCDVELVCGLIDLRAEVRNLAGAKIHARIITPTPNLTLLRVAPAASAGNRELMSRRLHNLHLYVETPTMQRHLARHFGLSSDVYPYLLASEHVPAPAADDRSADHRVAIGYFGAMRNEKGFSRLQPILTLVASSRKPDSPDLRFFVHASDAGSADVERLKRSFEAVEKKGLEIELKAGALSPECYRRHLMAVDAVLLPHTGARYRLSSSGILCEALAMAKPVIYSEGLSFEDSCHPDSSIKAGSDEAFAHAILAVASDIESYRRGAATRASQYAREIAACPLLHRLKVCGS